MFDEMFQQNASKVAIHVYFCRYRLGHLLEEIKTNKKPMCVLDSKCISLEHFIQHKPLTSEE